MPDKKVQQVGVKIELRFPDKTITMEGQTDMPEAEIDLPQSALELLNGCMCFVEAHRLRNLIRSSRIAFPKTIDWEIKPNS